MSRGSFPSAALYATLWHLETSGRVHVTDYRQAGVNIEEGYRAVSKYGEHARKTRIPGVLNGLGSFAGMFAFPSGMKEPVLVSGTDGVGTKLEIAFTVKKYDTVGIDCVAMCVNDILCLGARPLFFLDYIACGKLDADIAGDIVKGVADGCVQSGCALLGGETAEMPGFYGEGMYDIAGFTVGAAEKGCLISGRAIREGVNLIGLASSGVHSNGFSLVRRLITDFSEPFPAAGTGKTVGDVLLEPTRIYVKPVLDMLKDFGPAGSGSIHGMAHITGGGFYENIPRMYDGNSGLVSVIEKGSWPIPPIFGEMERRGADPSRMYHTFNMGVGFVLAAAAGDSERIIERFRSAGTEAYKIGHVARGRQTDSAVVFRE